MKCILAVVLALGVTLVSAEAQAPTSPPKSPKDVVKDYFKFEVSGGRLTTEGWYKAADFFVRPIPPPQNKKIVIIYKDFSVWDRPIEIKVTTARVAVGIEPEGRIDSTLHLVPSGLTPKAGILYDLVLTDKHWELGHNGQTREVTGPLEWRIIQSDPVIWVTVDTAIRYVTLMRDKTKDSVIKKNADATLAKLKALE